MNRADKELLRLLSFAYITYRLYNANRKGAVTRKFKNWQVLTGFIKLSVSPTKSRICSEKALAIEGVT